MSTTKSEPFYQKRFITSSICTTPPLQLKPSLDFSELNSKGNEVGLLFEGIVVESTNIMLIF